MTPWILLALLAWPAATKLQPVSSCFAGWPAAEAERCCDVSLGPRGDENCWDAAFTFETCCSETFNFDVQYCCGTSTKCQNFSLDCGRGRRCDIKRKKDKSHRGISARNSTCDDGSPLWPPRYLAVEHKEGDLEDGHRLSLQGTIYLTDKMMRMFEAALQGQHQLFQQRSTDPCLGLFAEREDIFGTCHQPGYTEVLSAKIARPLRYLDCSSCTLPDCKIYSLVFSLRSDINARFEDRLILSVPGACTHGDVAFRILPHIISQRAQGALVLTDVDLHHFVPGDTCLDDGQPSAWPALLVCLPLMLLPRLFNGSGAPRKIPGSLDAVDFVRAIALWRTCTYHWGVAFPFASFTTFMHDILGPNDPALGELLRSRFDTCLEGLYTIITLFLVFQCDSFQMFCKRLIRKVVRQFVPSICIFMSQPVLLFALSPMNCLRTNELTWANTSFSEGIIRSLQMHPMPDPYFNWALALNMKQFLALGILSILRKRFPWSSQTCCVLCWAYLIGLSQQPSACGFLNEATRVTENSGINMHYSFWLNWFPTALLLLNVDTFLRSPQAVLMMVRLKQTFGSLLVSLSILMLLASFWIGNPIFQLDWKQLGFQDCSTHGSAKTGGIPYVLSCLPFHVTAFALLHLAAASIEEASQPKAVRLGFLQGILHPQTFILQMVAPVVHRLRDVGLAFSLWHHQMFRLFRVHQPSWCALMEAARPEPLDMWDKLAAMLWDQLLFFLPLAFGTFVMAWLTYHLVEKPWSWPLRSLLERCPTPFLYAMAMAYVLLHNICWWTLRGETFFA